MSTWLVPLADAAADGGCGGKAANLARLIAAGLPVPDGFAIRGEAFRAALGELSIGEVDAAGHALEEAAVRLESSGGEALGDGLADEVRVRAAALGVVAVRSSATLEDGDAGAAAGVFSSRRAVAAADVWAAVRAVWTSALTPLAVAYARRRGGELATVGVIVQRFVRGERLTVYTRPPDGGEVAWIQRGADLERIARADPTGGDGDDLEGLRDGRGDARRALRLALAAETAIDAGERGADVELVRGDDGALWVVQARPIVRAARSPARQPAPPIATAALADGRCWTWDVAHNPDPLSPAQADLVARVAEIAPWSLRVCAGYLYGAVREDIAPVVAPADAAELDARAAALLGAMDRALGGAAPEFPDDAPVMLADALARYVAFYAPWAELSRLVAAARRALPEQLRARGDETPEATAAAWIARPSAVEKLLVAAARGERSEVRVLHELAALAPAWDVAVPTYGERPALLRDAIARARAAPIATVHAESPPAELAAAVELACAAADLAERDDLAFARAQWLVRRSILARARALGLDADDACWVPLDDLLAGPGSGGAALDRDTAHRRAAAARAAAARAARWDMPLVVGGTPAPAGEPLRGAGHGARATGRVVRYASLATAVAAGHGDVIVARAITPALAVLVAGCAALVSETGGLLDHGAALARELGVPCVVGCAGAWTALADGDLVRVDGAAGIVERL